MIKTYAIETTEETYLRIWQKINFGKEILESKFFGNNKIPETAESYRLSVFQYDANTRLCYFHNCLYWVTSEEKLYNYLDTGRAVTLTEEYSHKNKLFIYNDLIITDEQVLDFEEYDYKSELNLKLLDEADTQIISLIFNEDLANITKRLLEEKRQKAEKLEIERQEDLKNRQAIEKKGSLLNQYKEMTLLEDTNIIIKDNYFIDKEAGFKVEFKDKVVNIFVKDDLIYDNSYETKFICIDFHNFLDKLIDIYKQGKYEEKIESKLHTANKKWLNFKIYSYDIETKAEVFIKEIKIENLINSKGKLRYKINGIKMPIQKMTNAIEFMQGGRWNRPDKVTLIGRLDKIEEYLEQIRLYSGKQLDLLEGKTVEIALNGLRIPIHFNIMAEDKENWEISIDNFKVKRNYTDVRNAFHNLYGGKISAISRICDELKAGAVLEDILIGRIKGYVESRRLAEERAEKLFNEFLENNKTKVFKKDGGYICKGKLKNYLVKMKNDEDCGVWTYPENNYVCINEATKTGQYLCKFDKLLQFCLCMVNDGNLREQIHTIR